MKHRAAKRFVIRTSDSGFGQPWSSRLGIAVTYMVIRQVLMLWFAMLLGSPSWNELWDAGIVGGISMRGFLHWTNAAVIVFVVVDFWGFVTHRHARPRPMILAYCVALIVLCGMQYAVWPTM
jgi:hypothetical protein